MTNEEIPSQIWKLKNLLIDRINSLACSNYLYTDYKHDWKYLGSSMQSIGKQIEELATKYEQPKED